MELHAPPKTGNVVLDRWLERLFEELMYVNGAIFSVTKSTHQSDIAINEVVTVTFDTEITGGGYFDSNTFTAPVSGKYLLIITLYLMYLDSAATYYIIRIVTSNRTYSAVTDPTKFSGDTLYWPFALTAIAEMNAGDTATVTLTQQGGTAQTNIHQSAYFSGVLLGR